MTNSFNRRINDLGLKYLPPASAEDLRVVLAEELSLSEKIALSLFQSNRQSGWRSLPIIETVNDLSLKISGGIARLKSHPAEITFEALIDIPAIPLDIQEFYKETHYVSLMGFCAEVGKTQDPELGQVNIQSKDPISSVVGTVQKENAQRIRAFWTLVFSTEPIAPGSVVTSLPPSGEILVSQKTSAGFLLSNLRIYPIDSNLVVNAAYPVLKETVEILPLLSLHRYKRFLDKGYTYGYPGEEPLSVGNNVTFNTKKIEPEDLMTALRRKFSNICAGLPNGENVQKRTVQNLFTGQILTNPGKAGEVARSPNGSLCLANDQRIFFSNQELLQNLAAFRVTTINNGNGQSLVAIGLNTNSPSGTRFSADKTDHKIYTLGGVECSGLGSFSNLGGTGSLQWTANAGNSLVSPGDSVIFAPGIIYPAGSGFTFPFNKIEKAWVSASITNSIITSISPENILIGQTQDPDNILGEYIEPFNGEQFLVIEGAATASLHYIYKKITVVADGTGVLVVPDSEKGCFAFIENIRGRIDKPVYGQATPGSTYNCLVYYPPRSLESWQLQMRYTQYQGNGVGGVDFLNGAKIITPPLFFIHTQGEGLSVHQGQALTAFVPVAMHLPAVDSGVPSYVFDAPVQLPGERYSGPSAVFRELPLLSAPNLAMPTPGQVIRAIANQSGSTRAMQVALYAGTQPIGFRSPVINSRRSFQCVVVFAVEKSNDKKIVIITHNVEGKDNKNIMANSSLETAIDLFEY
ncbi:MAG: hypothetical protein WBB28_01395 [Crinalium sp.]